MATVKVTKAQKFAMLRAIPAVAENPMLVEFIDHELELLAKKNSADRKPTEKQMENDTIKDAILEVMENDPNRMFSITELLKEVPNLPDGMTNQRMSALVRQLKDAGLVERFEEKRKAYFRYIKA